MQANLQQGLFAVQFLLEPAQRLLNRLSFSKFNFRHIQGLMGGTAVSGTGLRSPRDEAGGANHAPGFSLAAFRPRIRISRLHHGKR